MEQEDKIKEYLRSLYSERPGYLRKLEAAASDDHVPIIRRQTQEFLKFLLRLKKPARILELGTAVGFSASFLAEYMPEDAVIVTVEKVPVRIVEAKNNLKESPHAGRITLLVGDALNVLRALNGETAGEDEIGVYYPGGGTSFRYADRKAFKGYPTRNHEPEGWKEGILCWDPSEFTGLQYDFVFLDAAKAQYMSYLPEIVRLLKPEALFITDNILQEGSIAESKFSIRRRDRTIHMRMREYLYEITHCEELDTVLLADGDGIAVSRRIK